MTHDEAEDIMKPMTERDEKGRVTHDRANRWRSCFPTHREARDFADMARKVEAVLKEIFTQKKCNTQTNNG